MNNLTKTLKRTIKTTIKPVEFFDPKYGLEIYPYLEREDKQGIHHLGRYHWARQVLAEINPITVLDIACGAGYGSYILAENLPEAKVTGADYDLRAVENSRKRYQRTNLSYIHGNMVTWQSEENGRSAPLGNYDAIVSFDTIEHIFHRDILLIRITENLNTGGVLLLSTPCGHQVSVLNPEAMHHKIEYSYSDLQNLLKRFFKTVLIPEDGTLPKVEFWNDVINKDKQRYLNLTNPVFCANPIKL